MIVLGVLVMLVLLTTLVCFLITFYSPSRKPVPEGHFELPPGRIYVPFHETLKGWMRDLRALPCREYRIRSFDGLTLYGRFFEFAPDAPVELMMHGYRGNAERDLCGGVQRAFALGHSVLLIDQRAAGKSDGHIITFGVKEHRDCLSWIELLIRELGPDVKILLTGVSMGASTVLMAAGTPLPKNVVGVLADCGFSSARDIIKKVIRQRKLPAGLLYPFVRLGAWLFGGFDVEYTPAVEAVRHSKLPIIFFHGDTDNYVPCEMSVINHEACVSPKKLVIIPGAGHGLCYPVAPERYLKELADFWVEVGVRKE
ncbi:MAG: alpha/beta hydrolase [Clostridia bacterium]|nr:alpha/beta hydrolase [Clostridia bacterium]